MSGHTEATEIDIEAVNGSGDGGVACGAQLIALTEATMGADDAALERERAGALEALGPAAFVDACGVIGAFNVVDRIANATGIPLDSPLLGMSQDVRDDLDLARFASAANTPGAR